jgi:hypothetical protein
MLIVLIYAVRLNIRPSFKLNIHNQCLDVDLVSPVYTTGHKSECHRAPDYKVRAGDMMHSGFILYKPGNKSNGALIYKLQRRQLHESTEIDKDTSNAFYILIIWRFSNSKKLYVDVLLIEHDKGFDWDKDNLEELYRKNDNWFRLCPDSATETWSLYGNTALITTFEIMNEDRILDITISEVKRDNCARMPARVDLER